MIESSSNAIATAAAVTEPQEQDRPQRSTYMQPWLLSQPSHYYQYLLSKTFLLFSSTLTTFALFYMIRKYGLRLILSYCMMTALVYQFVNRILFWIRKRFKLRFLRGYDYDEDDEELMNRLQQRHHRMIQWQTSRYSLNPYVSSQLSLMLVEDFTPAHYDILLQLDEDLPNRGRASEDIIQSLPRMVISANDDNSDAGRQLDTGSVNTNNINGNRNTLSSSSATHSKDVHEGWGVCAICMDAMIPNQKVIICPCLHKFHADTCLVPWLRQKGTCPICQKRVD